VACPIDISFSEECEEIKVIDAYGLVADSGVGEIEKTPVVDGGE
jgi:hypothetical protein